MALLLLVSVIPASASAASEERAKTPSFEDFYVEGGYVFTAYLPSLDTVSLTSNRWQSVDGKVSAALLGSMAFASYPDGWRIGEKGGVYWRQYHSKNSGYNSAMGVTLPAELIPSGDFTVEIVASYYGLEEEDGTPHVTNKDANIYGIGAGDAICVGNVRSYGWNCLNSSSTTDYLGNRWFFTPYVYGAHGTQFAGKDVFGVGMGEEHIYAMTGMTVPTNLTVSYDRAEDKQSFLLTQSMDFVTVKTSSVTLASIHNPEGLTAIPDTNDASFATLTASVSLKLQFLVGIPSHIYSIRLYDRVLTAAEQKQNHFADMAGYYGLNLAPTATMTASELEALYDAVSAYGYGGDEEVAGELQGLINGAALSDYDALYDKTNMTVLLTAFTGAHLSGNTWENTASGADAILVGPLWKRQNGGVGYTMTYGDWLGDKPFGSNYVDLTAANLPTGNYVVEVLQTMEGITNADGTRYTDAVAQNGLYSANYACYEIGGTKLTGFVSLSSVTSNCSLTLRCSYKKDGYWSTDNGQYWLGGSSASFSTVSQYAPVAVTFTGTKGTFSRSNKNLYSSATATEAETSRTHTVSDRTGLALTLSIDGTQKYAVNTVETGTVSINPESFRVNTFYTRYEKFLQTTYIEGGSFRIARNLPGTLYSVKVYTVAPSEAQKAQNHFADLCGYYGLDVRGVEELTAAEKTELYTAFASHTILPVNADHTQEREALQALVTAKTARILHDRLGHGDVDGDGEVTTADATLLLKYLADWQISLPHPDRADVDHDGGITVRDAQKLLQYLAEYPGATL